MSPWILYALATSVIVGLAAYVAASALERLSRPTRWIWVAGMLTTIVIPLAAAVAGGASPETAKALSLAEMAASGASLTGSAGGGGSTLDEVLIMVWLAGSVALTFVLIHSFVALEQARGGWLRKMVDGTRVWVSQETGPAVVGFLDPAIVLPRWAMERARPHRSLIVLHEKEHLWAGDSRLLFGALLLLVAMPWNPVLWWQWRRLKLAIEIDCDRRVLNADPDVDRYGRLLLEVAGRASRKSIPMAAFAESRSFLERRIRVMTSRRAGNRAAWAGAFLAAIFLAPTALVGLPAPESLPIDIGARILAWWPPESEAVSHASAGAHRASAVGDTTPRTVVFESPNRTNFYYVVTTRPSDGFRYQAVPVDAVTMARSGRVGQSDTVPDESSTFTYEVQTLQQTPKLLNIAEVQRIISASYPRMLQDAGIGGTSDVQFVIRTDGSVDPASIKAVEATRPEFGEAAVLVAKQFRFSPGTYQGEPVRVLTTMPITWQPASGSVGDASTPAPSGR